jgi:hypothetical protein
MTMKRLVLVLIFFGLAGLTASSYQQLHFGTKTAAFFSVGGNGGEARPAGGPPAFGRGGRMGRGFAEPGTRPASPEEATLTDRQPGMAPPAGGPFPQRQGRPLGRGPGNASVISMANVLRYAVILLFVTVLTVLTDRRVRLAPAPNH